MSSRFATKKIKRWKLNKLKPHPRQSVFRLHTQREIEDLADKLHVEKQIAPVEITPDGYIICGHGRVAAAKHLGWESVYVWVRADLAKKGEDAVFQRLVEDNLRRRPLSKLGLGRAYLALKEQEYDTWRAREQEEARGDFRDYLGEVMGCDGTTAERWARLAVLPSEYDRLIESNLLTQQQAAKIVKHLPADIRERLGRKLAEIAAEDVDRKTKKQKIREAVDGRLGRRNTATKRASGDRATPLATALTKVAQELPEPVASFVDQVDSSRSTHALLRTLDRKYPREIKDLSGAKLDVGELDVEQLSRNVIAMLALLHVAKVAKG